VTRSKWGVRFTPENCRGGRQPARLLRATSGLMQRSKTTLLDHLVGKREYFIGKLEPERLRGLQVDDELELSRLLDR
jgi:hypothetical protein